MNNHKFNKTTKKVESSSDDESGDLVPITKTVVKQSVPTSVGQHSGAENGSTSVGPTGGITCVYCNEIHKFSPFNVKTTSEFVKKEFVFRRSPETHKYCSTIVTEAKINPEFEFVPVTEEIIRTDTVRAHHVVFWSDGINVFGSSCLIALIVNKSKYIDASTIQSLAKSIYCSKWWEDLFLSIANAGPLNESIPRAKSYIIMLREFLAINLNVQTSVRDFVFSRFNARLRTLEDIKQRENEAIAIAKLEEVEEQKKAERLRKQQEEEEHIKLTRELNIIDDVGPTMTIMESLIKKLNTPRATRDAKFIAAINPEGNIVADLTMKLGEKSHLQEGINFDSLKKKYDVWKFYKEQQKLLEAGEIKFKKPKWVSGNKAEADDFSIPEIPIVSDDLRKPRDELKLSKTQQAQYKAAYDEYKKIKKNGMPTSRIVLDRWQSEAIQLIRSGQSCLITGPTSGGKTYVMMDGLNNIITDHGDETIIVVAPTFHLAYQTYANVVATFPTKSPAIITSELIHIPKDSNILIGSSAEILNYLVTKNRRYHVGIFDEIHVASKAYCDDDSKIEKIRAITYARLLAKCERQVIAASATLVNEDGMRQFMSEQMNQIRSEGNKLVMSDIKLVKYSTRAVPLQEYRYDNVSINPIVRDVNGVDTTFNADAPIVEINIDSQHMFDLLIQMRDREMTPTIVFESTDDLAWKSYAAFIDYVEQMEARDYNCYNQMADIMNKIIESYNEAFDVKMSEVPEDDNTDASRIRAGVKGNGKRDAVIRAIKKMRSDAINSIVKEATAYFTRSVVAFNSIETTSLCVITKDKIKSKMLRTIAKLVGEANNDLIRQPVFAVSQAHIDMAMLISVFEEMIDEQAEIIAPIVKDKGSYFKFSKSSYCTELLKAIRNPGSNEESWKHRKRMIALAEAQNINPKDIDAITDVILRGLDFGIAIVSNSLPFVIQNIVLESLKKKDMGVVFAAESMSMGINYPLRSVVIKGHTRNCSINPGKSIQMAGRCGRRGMDDQAHVIYYGIDNADKAHYNFIPPVSYPADFYLDSSRDDFGSTISDYTELATHMGEVLLTKYFESNDKKQSKVAISCTKSGGRVKEFKKTQNGWQKKAFGKFAGVVEKRADDIRDSKMIAERAFLESLAKRSEYLHPVVIKIAHIAGFSEAKANELAIMICDLDEGNINQEYYVGAFQRSQDVKVLMNMMIELYNHYATSSHQNFLNFVEKIMIMLRGCCNLLIKHAR